MPNLVVRQMDVMIRVPTLLEPGHQFIRHHVSGLNLVVFSREKQDRAVDVFKGNFSRLAGKGPR
jgi:hypothetical protein